jgi:PleD family two-component response regulator
MTAIAPARVGKENNARRNGSILVVDDDPTIVDLLIEVLTDDGYIAYADQRLAPCGA